LPSAVRTRVCRVDAPSALLGRSLGGALPIPCIACAPTQAVLRCSLLAYHRTPRIFVRRRQRAAFKCGGGRECVATDDRLHDQRNANQEFTVVGKFVRCRRPAEPLAATKTNFPFEILAKSNVADPTQLLGRSRVG